MQQGETIPGKLGRVPVSFPSRSLRVIRRGTLLLSLYAIGPSLDCSGNIPTDALQYPYSLSIV
jgi:hypothetical protein